MYYIITFIKIQYFYASNINKILFFPFPPSESASTYDIAVPGGADRPLWDSRQCHKYYGVTYAERK